MLVVLFRTWVTLAESFFANKVICEPNFCWRCCEHVGVKITQSGSKHVFKYSIARRSASNTSYEVIICCKSVSSCSMSGLPCKFSRYAFDFMVGWWFLTTGRPVADWQKAFLPSTWQKSRFMTGALTQRTGKVDKGADLRHTLLASVSYFPHLRNQRCEAWQYLAKEQRPGPSGQVVSVCVILSSEEAQAQGRVGDQVDPQVLAHRLDGLLLWASTYQAELDLHV